jgi:hypothetical protein
VSVSQVTSFKVSGVNSLALLTIDTPSIGLLDTQGNGSLGLIVGGFNTNEDNHTIDRYPIYSMDTVNLFGIGSISSLPNATIINFNATGNNFNAIGFNENKGLTNIYFVDNPHLKAISWPAMQVLNNITISGNPSLADSVGWSVQNVTNYYVTGMFDNQFA